MRPRETVRHVVDSQGNCWCGSDHSHELAKDGACACTKPSCSNVHNTPPHRLYRAPKMGRV